MPNYSFIDPDFSDSSIITSGNFFQVSPNTEIMKDKVLVINGGNWTNVKKQDTWGINGGNWSQIDFCSHLRPELVQYGLPSCELECKHMTSKEDVVVDGVVVDTLYEYMEVHI